jgi:hypothetical protein
MQLILNDPAQAHHAISKAWQEVKNNLVAGRKQILEIKDFEESLTIQQRKYYHGVVLLNIAKQAEVNGNKFSLETWKEHFRKELLGKKRVKVINPITGKKSYRWDRVSSEDLGVKKYNILIEQVTAFAVTDLGVNFDMDFETWKANEDSQA